jgi:inosine/xanthosine triphosphate pyrophosphatase family protein
MGRSSSPRAQIVYCSWSDFKKEEWQAVRFTHSLPSAPDRKLDEMFELQFRKVATKEPLLCDLKEMVRATALSAYQEARVPCIVEHAGLILEGHEDKSYPGGLTQPMWDALGAEAFLQSVRPMSDRAIARAVIGYCDGLTIKIFVGETPGCLSDVPRGAREFYWDTVFCPEGGHGKTYSEIVGHDLSGLARKMEISQSIKALKSFMEHRILNEPALFPGL